jgi:DNA helicase-2/ATP-dependent DNA helicase PcrA
VEHPSPIAGAVASVDRFDQAVAGLTDSQRLAVFAPSASLCIVAGAGSGKTRVLTLRVARRIRDGSAEADHTVVCTFTRKAAHELRHRLSTFGVAVSTPAPAGGVPTPGVRAGTLHQLALTLLRRHARDAGDPPPVLAEHRFRTISSLAGDPSLASSMDTEIGWAKARCLAPEEYVTAALSSGRSVAAGLDRTAEVFASYQAGLRRRRSLDLDDVLIHAADLVGADAGFAEAVHWRYRHVSVDEFQDVNPAQFRLIATLLGDGGDLCVVGDPNQAIYGWNGADPALLSELPTLMPQIEVVRLGENHRSSPQVVAAATAALGRTTAPPPRSAAEAGPLAVVTAYDSDVAEADGVAALLQSRMEDGAAWSQQAVLARTHDQLATVGRSLSRAGIPYRLAPGPESPQGAVHVAPKQGKQGWRGRGGNDEGRDEDAVELATFHRAKGLEWESVHVVGIEEGFVPIVFAESPEARAEERRLLYVALTRPSKGLYCSWAKTRRMANGREMERQPSPWLAAVARVSRTGSGRLAPRDAGRLIAEIRAGLDR